MKPKNLLFTISTLSLIELAKSLTQWSTIKTNGRMVESAAVCGFNAEYVVQGEGSEFNTYTIDWTTGAATSVKTISLTGYTNIAGSSFMGAMFTPNVVFTAHNALRFNADPNQSNNDERYDVVLGEFLYHPHWAKGTSFVFFSTDLATAGKYRVYRVQTDTKNGVKIFTNTEGKTQTTASWSGLLGCWCRSITLTLEGCLTTRTDM